MAQRSLNLLRAKVFSGGWNLRDAPGELGPNESQDLENVTLDERGGVTKRLGYAKVNSTAFTGGLVVATHNSGVLSAVVTQAGKDLYLGTTNTSRHTFSTSARAGFADFNGAVYAIHPVDGVLSTTDGLSWSAVAGSPKGTALLVAKNRLVAVGDPTAGSGTTMSACAIGDATDWATTAGHGWTNKIREVNDSPLVALTAAGGVDIAGRDGFVVCKQNASYRVYDSDTGAYFVMDPSVGAASSLATVTYPGRVIVINQNGIFVSNGVNEFVEASAKIGPLFRDSQLAFDQLDLFCAGRKGDRVRFSVPRAGQTANNLSLEYHPVQGWIVPGTDAASCYTTYGINAEKLYGGHPSTSGRVYEFDSGGSDDGTDIASYFQTRWFEPNDGYLTQMWRLRVDGRGTFSIYARKDGQTAGGERFDFDLTGDTPTYDSGTLYDSGALYGPASFETTADDYINDTCNSVSFRVQETSSLTATAPQILGSGTAPTVGAWALYGLDLEHVRLGIA